MSELWRAVVGYEGLYEVSSEGRLRSARRRGTPGGVLSRKRAKRGGYWAVSLLRGCRQRTRSVHSLVLEAFVGPRPDGADIRHLDGDPTNPNLGNLTYGSRSENGLDKRRHGTDHNVAKTHCPQGHPYDDENTRVLLSRPGARYCKACERVRAPHSNPDYDDAWRP